jgi:hypothetical protein
MKKLITLTALSAGLLAPLPALSGPLTTTAQIYTFNFNGNANTSFSFTGFDTALGTLNSVHFEWTLNKSINNTVFNLNPTAQAVGNPLALTAFSDSTFQGTGIASALTATHTLTTPSFSGNVVNGLSTVGSASAPTLSGAVCLSNDGSCGIGSSNLSAYIGGANLFNINFLNDTNQSGSVPSLVFTGNNSTTAGTASIFYDYTAATPPSVPEPTTLGLTGLAFALLGFRIKK